MSLSEKQIEDFLDECVRPRGGVAVKMGNQGWPDRLVLLPGARLGFLELKRPGEEPEPLQVERLATTDQPYSLVTQSGSRTLVMGVWRYGLGPTSCPDCGRVVSPRAARVVRMLP